MLKELIAKSALYILTKTTGLNLSSGWYSRNGYEIARLLGGEPTWTGKTIDEHTANNISTAFACKRAIAETISCLPLHLYEYTSSGKRIADKHPLDWVLYAEANDEMSARHVRETMTGHCVFWGNAWALKVRRGKKGSTIGLWPWTPDSVRYDRVKADNRLVWIHKDGNSAEKTYEADEVFHLPGLGYDGVLGYSVISLARQSLGLASIQDEYAARFFAQGGRKPYYLKKATRFKTDQDFNEFRRRWEETYSGSVNFHRAPILEGDIELKELGMPLEDAQLLASRLASVPEICRWFRVFPFQVGHMDQLTFNNVEHLSLQAIQYTYSSWMIRWETEINRQLLTPEEKGRYYAKHNVNALLRGDFKSRMEGYSIALQNGFMSRDEVRDLEDWNPIPNNAGRSYTIQLNMQTLPGTGEPTVAELATLTKIQQLLEKENGGNNAA